MKQYRLIFALSTSLLAIAILAQGTSVEKDSEEMTMHDFMEDYVEWGEKQFKKGNKEPLKKMLEVMPSLALADDKEKWEEIVNKYIESGKYMASCKACHVDYKKPYKKAHKKRLVSIPGEILELKQKK